NVQSHRHPNCRGYLRPRRRLLFREGSEAAVWRALLGTTVAGSAELGRAIAKGSSRVVGDAAMRWSRVERCDFYNPFRLDSELSLLDGHLAPAMTRRYLDPAAPVLADPDAH